MKDYQTDLELTIFSDYENGLISKEEMCKAIAELRISALKENLNKKGE